MPFKDDEARKAEARKYDKEYCQTNREYLLLKQKEKSKRHIEKVGDWLN